MGELFDTCEKFRVTITEKRRQLELIENKMKSLNIQPDEVAEVFKTEEQIQALANEKEAYMRKWVFTFYKELHPEHLDMTEDDYQRYKSILMDNRTKKGYSILSFIRGEYPYREAPNPEVS